jgi:2-succinyl-5-enolpyruvyl-6-hydroxy-3-cyclohexene-1-carboxylate synthase
MSSATDTYTLLRAFCQELARCGMTDACTSPGSRCAPLVLSLAREPGLRLHSHVDERCAGFFALGLAKTTARPVAVACTSGTAAAELLPAAIEAREARVPLLLLTADRPAELRDNGAGQAIDQLKLYGSTAKWFVEVELADAQAPQLRWIRTLACRAYRTALDGRPGAVHLNFPLRDPLVTDEPLPPDDTARADGAPFLRQGVRPRSSAGPDATVALVDALASSCRGLVVAGRHERPTPLGECAAAFAEAVGWPLLADPMSGARRGDAAIAHYDALLRVEEVARDLQPDLVLRVGDLPVSKPLRAWLASLDSIPQLAIDLEGAWQDPDGVVSESFAIEPAAALAALATRASECGTAPPAEDGWLERWRAADLVAAEAIEAVLAAEPLSEPAIAAELGRALPSSSIVFVASSMPVRDIETFWPVRPAPPRVLCNRGANGIDGTVSSAFGAAAASERPVVLLTGDVALAHDIGGLLAHSRLGLAMTIVLLENGGGAIFDFLPVAASAMARERSGEDTADVYTRHVATPTGLDFARAAALYGLRHERAEDIDAFRAALEREVASDGCAIIEVPSDRTANVAVHRRVWETVQTAVRAAAVDAA